MKRKGGKSEIEIHGYELYLIHTHTKKTNCKILWSWGFAVKAIAKNFVDYTLWRKKRFHNKSGILSFFSLLTMEYFASYIGWYNKWIHHSLPLQRSFLLYLVNDCLKGRLFWLKISSSFPVLFSSLIYFSKRKSTFVFFRLTWLPTISPKQRTRICSHSRNIREYCCYN